MVAAPASRPDQAGAACAHCARPFAAFADHHVCPGCGKPQPVVAGADLFEALGAPRAFAQDRAALEKRFYEVSRLLHPDRFGAVGGDSLALSIERMSFVNQAYQTLRDAGRLRDHLLEARGLKVEGARGQVPGVSQDASASVAMPMMILAESWFELQDALADDPATARSRLAAFEGELAGVRKSALERLAQTERAIDAAGFDQAGALWEKLAAQAREQSYLQSMERDVRRIAEKLGGRA